MRLLSAIIFVLAFSGLSGWSQAGTRKPNIVFILADDLGWTDTEAYGSKYYETPNIDRLAAQGMRFTSYHNCQNCAPTRAALMSGQYGARTGIYTVGGTDRFDWSMRPLRPVENVTKLPLDKITIAQSLQQAGYATGMFGKWHLGQDGDHFPGKRGFDEAITSEGKHFQFKTEPPVEHPTDAYLADWLTDRPADYTLDGESLVPLFRDGNAGLNRNAIYQHFPGYLGAGPGNWRTTPVATIISGDWKLMEFFEDNHLELYNLRDDIGETKNLALVQPGTTKELHDKLLAWRAGIHAPMPEPNSGRGAHPTAKKQGGKNSKKTQPNP